MGLFVDIKKRLNGFSLDVQWRMDNEIAVVFGHSGAGKSLTLKAIAGLMRPDEGAIVARGRTLFERNGRLRVDLPPQKRHMGYVFQDLALFPHMTVRENIAFGLKAKHGRQSGETERMLKLFHIEGLAGRYPREISGGQKQRVALARALIGRPGVLLLDEPFSALDRGLRDEMGRLLVDVRREFGIPVVLVTHDAGEARAVADRLIVYSGGRVVQTGSPEEVTGRPTSDEVAALLGQVIPQKTGSASV